MPAVRSSVAVAEGNAGRYSVDAHLTHAPSATEAFAETHVRRLEAMRRAGLAIRDPDGSWSIAADHLDQVSRHEAGRARAAPVRVDLLSSPLGRESGREGGCQYVLTLGFAVL